MATETQAPSVPTVTLTIDGKEVRVPKGTNVIEAARKLGIDIPYLCYHHQLTAFGGCRLCLVEVEKVPKLLAACNTTAADGMIVRTATDKVKSQRAASLEFILLNHPLDCPVCDKGGECELQDRTYEHSNALSRMTEPKVHIEDYDLGPLIVRNQDRCIICKRCVTVMEEVVGDPVLEFGQRGVTTEVYTFEHSHFPAGFSGNTIRVCPVGALMSKPFRFRARPWELIKTPGVCSLCSVGCNLREDTRENKLLRVVGLENPHVNDGWLCDRGQFGCDYVNSERRLTAPLIRRESGEFEEVSWEEALTTIVTKLREVREAGEAGFGAIGSERAANEDNFVLQQFTREVMGSPNIDHRMGSTRTNYSARPHPGAIEALPKADVVLILGSDLTADAPVLDLILKRSVLPKKAKLIIANPRKTELNRFAAQWLQYTPGQEIALLNALAKAIIDHSLAAESAASGAGWAEMHQGPGGALAELCAAAGVSEQAAVDAATLFAGAKLGSIIFGQDAADSRDGSCLPAALQNLAALSGHTEKPGHVLLEAVREANTWGARDLGVLPDAGVGGAPAARGLSTGEMLQAAAAGKLQALYVIQSNPAVDYPGDLARRALQDVPFLVVQDLFLTETAQLAHVVLPSVSVAERNCTLTNVERRIQRTLRGLDPRGGARPEWQVLNMLAEDLGRPLGYTTDGSVTRAIRAALASTNGAGQGAGLQRVETPRSLGTDANFPMRLFTGRLMFDRSTLQRESKVLPALAPEPFAEIHVADAARLGIADGAAVTVSTASGQLGLVARLTENVPAGGVFVPSGYCEAPAAGLFTEGAVMVPCRIAPAAC